VCCSVLQYLQCVAVSCSVSQYVAVMSIWSWLLRQLNNSLGRAEDRARPAKYRALWTECRAFLAKHTVAEGEMSTEDARGPFWQNIGLSWQNNLFGRAKLRQHHYTIAREGLERFWGTHAHTHTHSDTHTHTHAHTNKWKDAQVDTVKLTNSTRKGERQRETEKKKEREKGTVIGRGGDKESTRERNRQTDTDTFRHRHRHRHRNRHEHAHHTPHTTYHMHMYKRIHMNTLTHAHHHTCTCKFTRRYRQKKTGRRTWNSGQCLRAFQYTHGCGIIYKKMCNKKCTRARHAVQRHLVVIPRGIRHRDAFAGFCAPPSDVSNWYYGIQYC